MTVPDRFRLLGTYATPRVRVGSRLLCESRDCDVIVTGYSDGRIPWPVGRRPGTSARGLVLCGALAAAVKREANQAICYWFGVTGQTVTKWRNALGVGIATEGTSRLHADTARTPAVAAARAKGHAKAGDPDRRAKIAAARRGKKRPRKDMLPAWKANTGRVPTPETRAKMSAAATARAKTFLPCGRRWAPDEDELVRTLPAPEVAARTGRPLGSVYSRREKLKVPDGRRKGAGGP